MAFSKSLGFVLLAALLISSTVAQSPAPAPSNVGGRRISPAPSPKKTTSPAPAPEVSPSPSPVAALTPESSASPPSPPLADSPTSDSPALSPSAISDSPTEAPGPAQGAAVSNSYAVFGSVAVMLTAAVLVI
ncbi:unnamed protein product [Arabidopsis lyrata]|uniref:Uncharacterized protein n=1 Tax=Arabidopsis lyrata subsp. lyrata TaxID=81972 RepID=D7MRA1_ARALL|nr:classical arabinogalactan protein 1 [Arabidopsis lyrata subsp. lyrata]EFH41154.1 hypothetical protein ARALYDRAFT_496633 [Arabidopsis lyrata subsp. lyrata]CAH8280775.1 unnamed protein product [Arabidopsis lyrata]|eukprot:XP_020871289.1 classical arabinogalactan protein 1 [Arabidopsis lyrata subsp. lyrata]